MGTVLERKTGYQRFLRDSGSIGLHPLIPTLMNDTNRLGSQTLWLCVQANPMVAHGMDETVLLAGHTMAFYTDAADCQSHLRAFHQPLCWFTAAAILIIQTSLLRQTPPDPA